MRRLQEEVKRGEREMGAAEGQMATMKQAQDKLLEELDATRGRLRETSNLLTALQVPATLRASQTLFRDKCHTRTVCVWGAGRARGPNTPT